MKYKIMLSVALFMALIQLQAQTYNYGLDVCNQDAKIEGKLNLSDAGESVLIGANAGLNDNGTVGNKNVAIGYGAAQFNVMGKENVIMGYEAGLLAEKNRNVLIGSEAGRNNPLEDNVLIGWKAGINATHNHNVAIGSNAGALANLKNVYVGVDSGFRNTGNYNVYLGGQTGTGSTNARYNTFMGRFAGNKSLKSNNTYVGAFAGSDNENGTDNVFLGVFTGGISIGSRNTFVGNRAGVDTSVVNNNIFLGFNAGQSATGSDQLYIENSGSLTPLIWGDFANPKILINGNMEVVGNLSYGTMNACSDLRFKKNIKSISGALSDILKIRGVVHEWRHDEFPDKEWKKGHEYGVIAQELEQYFPELVVEDSEGFKMVNYIKLTPILIESVNAQQKLIDQQSRELQELKSKKSELGDISVSIEKLEALLTSKTSQK